MTARIEPSNYYWIHARTRDVQATVPSNQKFTTHLPSTVTLIRSVATAVFAAYLVAKIGLTVWALPVVAIAASFIAYTVVKNFFMQDPLVNAMYTIAGGKKEYNELPVWNIIPQKKLYETISAIEWGNLEHPLYRALTSDGRKVLIVKGYGAVDKTQTTLAFVEKLGIYDVPRVISNLHELADSALDAIAQPLTTSPTLGNVCNRDLNSGFYSNGHSSVRYSTSMHSSITSEMINELVQQREGRPVIVPQIEVLE